MSEMKKEYIVDESAESKEVFEKRVAEIICALKEKYQLDFTDRRIPESRIVELLARIQNVFGSLENVRDKKILDLGGGARIDKETLEIMEKIEEIDRDKNPLEYKRLENILIEKGKYDVATSDGEFEPWLSRALLELGAHPVVVDIGDNEGEEFEHYQRNLLESGALDFLADKSFDGVIMSLLLNSPQLMEKTSITEREKMKEELMKQIKRLLKDDGKEIDVHGYIENAD